jgi:hypothetical protein
MKFDLKQYQTKSGEILLYCGAPDFEKLSFSTRIGRFGIVVLNKVTKMRFRIGISNGSFFLVFK